MIKQDNSPEKELNEMEMSNWSDIEFKAMIIKLLKTMKQDIETIKKDQSEIKNAISEINKTQEGINIRLDETEDQINNLEDKSQKTLKQSSKKNF